VVIARKKPEQQGGPANLAQIYAELKRQGKVVNLLATKKKLTAEHERKMSNAGFKDSVMDLLRKIEKQCAGDASGNYFARWNALKKATGVGTQLR
jgi:membrane carboxypeptidase/penicillin-binding protein PbpC